ncbi:hypothetical protein SZ64_10460 [Erythrobacter sp. SG61-1L]|uniref:TonB-dependent receptor domain-containing protein n=1 Tax=Erythrobacter sp. SG61-1L TaxID=1603897 RepID=UPI0006C90BF1|nr:TonB-dependent receptor [Erythrobacter sp. SG61-1L]KPL68490.1 hypothetical protein SZ64_10460 [Erythrobacter sp. SG61-1L]
MRDWKGARGRLAARASILVLVLTGVGGWAGSAAAQDADPQASGEAGETSDIIVTGSRLLRRDLSATSPIVTVGDEFLDAQAGGTVGVKLQQLPQLTPGANELTGSGQPTGRATVDLRGLGANRTLVLADGRRLQPSTSQLVVDLNTIPAALVESVEIITGGASAVYGSDAIAGVVNLKLRDDFEGLEVSGQYNVTEKGDGEEYVADALFGSNFADGRGNVVFGVGYLHRGAAYFNNRDFYRRAFALGAPPWGSDLLPEGNFVPDAGNLPDQSVLNSVFSNYGVAAGTVAASNVLSFNADGSLYSQFGAANYGGPLNDAYVLSPFSNAIAYNLGTLQLLTSPTDRYSAFGKAEYDITDNVTAYVQAMYTDYKSTTNYGAGLQTQGTTAVVPVDNAFIPDDLATILASRPDPDAPFSMRKLWLATGTSVTTYNNSVYQIVAGLRGEFGDSRWHWDIYGSHGKTEIRTTQESGGASFSRIQALLTSRSDGEGNYVAPYIPSGNGSNALLPNPAYASAVNDGGRSYKAGDGSTPCPNGLNIFGNGAIDQSCLDFLQIHPSNLTVLKQDVVEGTLQGELFDLPAGPVSLLVGGAWRRNTYDYKPDPAATDQVGSFLSLPVSGNTEATEVFAEAAIPLLKDAGLIQSLDLSLAWRYSDYAYSGGVHTYKADLDMALSDSFRLRGGYQRAIRAPNVTELFNPDVPAPALLGAEDPCNFDSALRGGSNGAAIRSLCLAQGVPNSIIDTYKSTFAGVQAIQGGNVNLVPEKADTYTAGLVFTPGSIGNVVDNFSASIDYYNISLNDAISTTSGDIVFARCFNVTGDNPAFDPANENCRQILRNSSSGAPDQVRTPYFNLGGIRTSGIDFALNMKFGLGNAGDLSLNTVLSYLIDFKVQSAPGSAFVPYDGTIGYGATGNNGAHPDIKANTTLTWSQEGKSLGLRWYYVDGMADVFGGPGVNAYSRFDLFGSVDVTDNLSLNAGVNNLFNVEPEATFGGLPGNTDSGTYDPLGRRYFVAAKVKF